eukprot:8715169-Pyramimonas_sp.AAC.3
MNLASWGRLGSAPGRPLGASCRALGSSGVRQGVLDKSFGDSGPFWTVLEASWGTLGPSWSFSGPRDPRGGGVVSDARPPCLLYTSDAADDTPCVDL